MKTKAVRLYGKNDLRLEEFELPEIRDDEILARVVTDSICMSTFKAQELGADHARVPNDVGSNPIIVGHEMCGELIKIGKKWRDKYSEGEKFAIQPSLSSRGGMLEAIGYSFHYAGGAATYIVIPPFYMEEDCILPYSGESYFCGSLAEPVSCIVGGYHSNYHLRNGEYTHDMGIVAGGKVALLAGVGPMGLGAVDYALHADRRPKLLVVTDIDEDRLSRARALFTEDEAEKCGVKLVFLNTSGLDAVEKLMKIADGTGYDDVFVYAPVRPVVEQADAILAHNGCLNFFAGPVDKKFSANFNFYNVHYKGTHVAGNTGGTTGDMRECLGMMSNNRLNPAVMITHVGGLNSVVETTKNLPNIKGGKKLIYTHLDMPLTAIADFGARGETDPMYKELAIICEKHNELWNVEAEKYLLATCKKI